MNVFILTIGDELLSGRVVNTNATFVGDEVTKIGAIVKRVISVGDDENEIKEELKRCFELSDVGDVVIMTGGLGPTHDDVTKTAVASLLQRKFVIHQDTLNRCKTIFERKGSEMPKINLSQAEVIEGSIVLQNDLGTAPCMVLKHVFGGRTVILLPGVPSEMKELMIQHVLPFLQKEVKTMIKYISLMTSGAAESVLAERIGNPEFFLGEKTKLAFLPNSSNGVRLCITTRGGKDGSYENVVNENERVKQFVFERVKPFVYSDSAEMTLECVVANLLMRNKLRFAIAESCTGGLVAHRLTNVSGSSTFFIHGSVIYSNEAKMRLGVKQETIEKFGAVSSEVAIELAHYVKDVNHCDIGVGITGIAGPTGATENKPVGLVWICVALGGKLKSSYKTHSAIYHSDRLTNKNHFSQMCLNKIREDLLALD